jgi:hypothetical protein
LSHHIYFQFLLEHSQLVYALKPWPESFGF